MLCSRWAAVETQFGWGIAMYTEETRDESIKLAAANSYWNRPCGNEIRFENYWADDIDFEGKTVGVVGAMRRIKERYSDIAKAVYVFDFNEQEGVLPSDMEEELLPQCDIVSITGSSIQNGTLPRLLELCRKDAYVMLTGPSVPQCPDLLDCGIDRLAGMSVTDPALMLEFIFNDTPGTPFVFGTPFLIKK